MSQGPRRGWVRAACAGLGAVLCAGAVGCTSADKDKDVPPKIGSSSVKQPGPGLPGLQTLPATSQGTGPNHRVPTGSGLTNGPGQPGGFAQPGSRNVQPAGGGSLVPGVAPGAGGFPSGGNFGNPPPPSMSGVGSPANHPAGAHGFNPPPVNLGEPTPPSAPGQFGTVTPPGGPLPPGGKPW